MKECITKEIRDFFYGVPNLPWDKVESIELTWLEFDDTYDYKLIIKPHIKVTFKK